MQVFSEGETAYAYAVSLCHAANFTAEVLAHQAPSVRGLASGALCKSTWKNTPHKPDPPSLPCHDRCVVPVSLTLAGTSSPAYLSSLKTKFGSLSQHFWTHACTVPGSTHSQWLLHMQARCVSMLKSTHERFLALRTHSDCSICRHAVVEDQVHIHLLAVQVLRAFAAAKIFRSNRGRNAAVEHQDHIHLYTYSYIFQIKQKQARRCRTSRPHPPLYILIYFFRSNRSRHAAVGHQDHIHL
eukprot:1159269-Pelagomonas_calceolata.AAC.4